MMHQQRTPEYDGHILKNNSKHILKHKICRTIQLTCIVQNRVMFNYF